LSSGHLEHCTSWYDILNFDCFDSSSHNGLISFNYTLSPESHLLDDHLVQHIMFYNLDDDDASIIELTVDIIHNSTPQSLCTEVDPTSLYLYALDL